MRAEGQSYGEIAEELGRSKADIYRVATTLGCESDPGSDASPLSC
jgi:DNA-binding MurR/RpiR family transcriptional regulator